MFDEQITFLYVADLQRSAEFYGDRLGLPLVQVQPAGCRIYRTGGNAYIGLCVARKDKEPAGGGVVLCLVTQDVDDWHDRLSAAGVPCDGRPRMNADYGIYHFYFTDPDGYLLEIQRFENPNWAGLTDG